MHGANFKLPCTIGLQHCDFQNFNPGVALTLNLKSLDCYENPGGYSQRAGAGSYSRHANSEFQSGSYSQRAGAGSYSWHTNAEFQSGSYSQSKPGRNWAATSDLHTCPIHCKVLTTAVTTPNLYFDSCPFPSPLERGGGWWRLKLKMSLRPLVSSGVEPPLPPQE